MTVAGGRQANAVAFILFSELSRNRSVVTSRKTEF